ncbi:MAG: hypothetical protein NXH72_05830 [Hyphomonadaceae bacterium]|nr:hypothetical protein [Hyphomonadaceae bacterium]
MRGFFLTGALLALVPTGLAQDETPPPPCSGDAFKQFDFWLGDWEVTTPDGNLAGENLITSEENGCLILERWSSVNGGTGQSYNYYNPATEKWRQVWVSQGAMIDYEGGLTESGSMKLEGTITYVANGLQAAFTGEWTPNEDGTVTQYFEQYDAEADQWNPWFTGLYTQKDHDTP